MEPNRLSRRSILAATPNVPEIGWIWIPDDGQLLPDPPRQGLPIIRTLNESNVGLQRAPGLRTLEEEIFKYFAWCRLGTLKAVLSPPHLYRNCTERLIVTRRSGDESDRRDRWGKHRLCRPIFPR